MDTKSSYLKAMVIEQQILKRTAITGKDYDFDENHDPNKPVMYWFQETKIGETLFVVFYSQACRWSACAGCNLPSVASKHHVNFKRIMAQIDFLFCQPDICSKAKSIKKVIVSNNGSILDEVTFSTTALLYLIAKLNIHFPNLAVLSLETRIEYVEVHELEVLSRAIKEGDTPTDLELAIGFECFNSRLRNDVFKKGLDFRKFEDFVKMIASYGLLLKCYFMQKPVAEMGDDEAIEDIKKSIDYLADISKKFNLKINMHLNPTYVAKGTILEDLFKEGKYSPPHLKDVALAALHAEGKKLSIFIGLSDEGLACSGGSFIRQGETEVVRLMELFNRSQDFLHLRKAVSSI